MLETKRITRGFTDIDRVENLYTTAFPESERTPMRILLWGAKKEFVDFLAFYDGDAFVGISYMITHERTTYVLYLAVNGQIRSKGYGTRMLEHIEALHTGNKIVLDIEPLDDSAENSKQREKRRAFYFRNGFAAAGFTMIDGSETYEVLVKGDGCSPSECMTLFKRFSGVLLAPFVRTKFVMADGSQAASR